MTGRILVVDAVPTNRIILRVKLSAAFYEVAQAGCGAAALARLEAAPPDLILCAAQLPDMSGPALCAALRQADPRGAPPVVLLQDGTDPGARLAALAAGADEVLSRPMDDRLLLARLRALLRCRDAEAELALREDTRRAIGLAEGGGEFRGPGVVQVIAPEGAPASARLLAALRQRLSDRLLPLDPAKALQAHPGLPPPDVIVVTEPPGASGTGLALLPQLRANRATRHCGLVYIARPGAPAEAASALDMGASDMVTEGSDPEELAFRITRQIRRKRAGDRLRADMQDGLRAALTDPLTGLYNRRYALPHLARLAERGGAARRPCAVLMADIDRFKQINDSLGHGAGDAVLQGLARRLREALRPADLITRWGGEEFMIVLPDTHARDALARAEALCAAVAARPMALPGGESVGVTLSVGVASLSWEETAQPLEIVARADAALYAAKRAGRNRALLAEGLHPLPGPRPPPPQAGMAPRALATRGIGKG